MGRKQVINRDEKVKRIMVGIVEVLTSTEANPLEAIQGFVHAISESAVDGMAQQLATRQDWMMAFCSYFMEVTEAVIERRGKDFADTVLNSGEPIEEVLKQQGITLDGDFATLARSLDEMVKQVRAATNSDGAEDEARIDAPSE